MSMGRPASSIYMSHIYCISPIDGNHINTKTKIHHALAQEAPPLRSKSYDVPRPYDEILPSHIKGQSVNPKSPTQLSMAYTTQGHHLTTLISLHKTFHLTPTPPKEPKDEEKG